MSTTKQRDSRKEQFWRRTVASWRQSGLSVRGFCRRHHLSEPSFFAWRRTLAERDARGANFVPVRVVPERRPVDGGTGAANNAESGLELLVAGGRRLRIGRGFDAATLRQLLAVLEESEEGRPCC